MRFKSLRLAPYRAFVDRTLRFDGDRGLHLVFGPNGAGKSTTLRGLRAALHGIEKEDFAMGRAPRDIRLGAELVRADGSTLAFTRRKGSKQPLYDAADEAPLAEELLTPFLGGLTREEFETLFGLDLETMVEGGKQLLEGKGEIGRALFGAALGGQLLASVEKRLEGQLSDLWARQSKKARLNQLRKRHDELERARNDATLRPTRFASERKELKRLVEEQNSLRDEVRALAEEANSLRRQGAGLLVLADLEAREAKRAALGDDEPLDVSLRDRVLGWNEERMALTRQRDELVADLRQEEASRVELSARAEALPADALERIQPLLDRREIMREASGELDEAREARDRAQGVRAHALVQAGLGPGQEACGEEDLVPAAETHRERLQQAESAARPADKERRTAEALEAARREEFEGIEERLVEALSRELEALRPFRGTLAELAALEVPGAERLEELSQQQRDLEAQLASRRVALQEAQERRERAAADLARLGAGGALPPTEDELLEARAARDERFAALLELREHSGAAPAADAVRVQAAIQHADELADRRTADLERAAERAQASQEQRDGEAARASASSDVKDLESRLAQLQGRHRALWSGLGGDPEAPASMLHWLERRGRALDRAEELREAARAALAEAHAAALERGAAHGAAIAAVVEARTGWEQWARTKGLDAEAGPGAALARLRARRDVDAAAAEERRAVARLDELQTTIRTFEADVRSLAEECAVAPAGADDAPLAERLAEGLRLASEEHQEASILLRNSERNAAKLRAQRDEAARALKEIMGSLIEAAGSEEDVPELLERAGRSGRLLELDTEITAIERRLSEEAGGVGREALQGLLRDGEACEAAAARLGAEASDVAARRDEREAAALELATRVGELRAREREGGSSAAADLEAQRLQVVAEMEEAGQDYLVARVARRLLDREVERYRLTTQGPILERAQELFGMLTLGAYERLVAAQTDRGKDEMVARRSDGSTVPVSGMSSGTCDQLYLALRIASVEHKLSEDVEPMPFIADDLFVNFDDERTEAGLRVLASLAERTQVIVFSHHESVVSTCGRLAAEGVPVEVVRLLDEATRVNSSEAPGGGVSS